MCAQAIGGGWWLETQNNTWPPNLLDAQRRARGRPLVPKLPPRFKGPGYGCSAGADTVCCFGNGSATCPPCGANATNPSSLFGCKVCVVVVGGKVQERIAM